MIKTLIFTKIDFFVVVRTTIIGMARPIKTDVRPFRTFLDTRFVKILN